LGCVITDFFSSTIVLSFPPSESKLLGGKCLTYIGTEGECGRDFEASGSPEEGKAFKVACIDDPYVDE
jgi:hypothetical protein